MFIKEYKLATKLYMKEGKDGYTAFKKVFYALN